MIKIVNSINGKKKVLKQTKKREREREKRIKKIINQK